MEKVLFVLLLFVSAAAAVAIVVIAATLSAGMFSAAGAKSTNEVCLTPDCIKIAARMLDSIDQSVEPCDDFFEYACGTWNRLHPIPEDRPNYSTFRKLDDELQSTLKELLEEPLKSADIDAVQNAKRLYQSCMNTSIIEEKQEAPLRQLIKEHGGWPVLDTNWSENSQDLSVIMAKLKTYNHVVFINHWINTDDKDSETNIIQIDQGQLGMPTRDYFLKGRDDKTLMIYQQLAINVALTMGADENRTIQQMTEMIDFEIELANITIPEEKRRDMEAIYQRYRLKDLYGNLTDQIDWVKYFVTIFDPLNITIDQEEEVVVYAVDYMRDLGKLIQKTPKRILINYVIWHVVMNRMNTLSQKFSDLKREFNKAVQGTETDRARWRLCINIVNDNLGMVVGRMYVEDHFEEKAKASATAMIKRIKESFREILMEVPWLDDSTKKVAKEKADDIKEKIGYPDYIMNDTALNLDYEGITLDEKHYFENMLNIMEVAVANNHKRLRLPVDRDRWSTAPAVVNAFYNSPINLISFPAGIFHPPFYHKNYPMSLNFGGIGMVIGHEITHGFDDKGRQYDKEGNLKMWWSVTDVENFKEKTQCIVDQYSNYTIPEVGLNINGRQTQGENIADNGGLKQAYRAYKKWTKSHPAEPALPGLNLTHDQLFFINFAQVWCGTNRPENYVQMIRASKHCPGKIRVIGTVSNSVDFAKAFSCAAGSNMNPINKCSVW